MKRVLVFGAGAVGRGFIGQIFSEAGWHVIFVDTDWVLVRALQTGSYRHTTVSDEIEAQTTVVNVDAIEGHDRAAVVRAVASADFIATAVGVANLVHIAPALAAGLRQRRRAIDIMLAENVQGAPTLMADLLAPHLGEEADGVLSSVGLLATSIGRMIPTPDPGALITDPSHITAEPYRELPLDISAARAPLPDVPELVGRPGVPFDFFVDRKLYVHNLGHCTTAYLGELMGEREIASAIRRPLVLAVVSAVMTAAVRALALEYGEPEAELQDHANELLTRFGNRRLRDTVERVGRDPQRKMAASDRFLGAFRLAARHGRERPITVAVALGTQKLLNSVPAHSAPAELDRIRCFVASTGGQDELQVLDRAVALLEQHGDLQELAQLAGLDS